jgi:hypothetical protein
MAGTKISVWNSAPITSTTATKTILEVTAAALTALFIKNAVISFDGTSNTGPKVLVELVRTKTKATGTSVGSVAWVNDNKGDPEAPQCTARENFSAEPTGGGVVIYKRLVHPQGDFTIPKSVKVEKDSTLAIRVTVSSAVNCVAGFEGEE